MSKKELNKNFCGGQSKAEYILMKFNLTEMNHYGFKVHSFNYLLRPIKAEED